MLVHKKIKEICKNFVLKKYNYSSLGYKRYYFEYQDYEVSWKKHFNSLWLYRKQEEIPLKFFEEFYIIRMIKKYLKEEEKNSFLKARNLGFNNKE